MEYLFVIQPTDPSQTEPQTDRESPSGTGQDPDTARTEASSGGTYAEKAGASSSEAPPEVGVGLTRGMALSRRGSGETGPPLYGSVYGPYTGRI